MLKKLRFLVFVGVLLICSIPLAAGAVSINYTHDTSGNEFISPYAGVITEDFEEGAVGSLAGLTPWSWSGNGAVQQGPLNVPDVASPPYGVSAKDASKYMSVPKLQNTGGAALNTVTVTNLGGAYNYFGLWWGSADTYNTLSFYESGGLVASFDGTAITTPNAANGYQIGPDQNLYVNFLGLPLFDSFQMTSFSAVGSSYAFESDNIAIGTVPEPTTMLLLGLGLLGVAGIRRKFKV